ncbi:hypothetical protein ACTFIY_004508 [Dictyostelium cf. discoideum]
MIIRFKLNEIECEINGIREDITILQACTANGIEIPRFCYHEKLTIAGNCRMCLVYVTNEEKLLAACGIPLDENFDDESIETEIDEILKAREGVMEFLLINHPLDCPICDQGGECDLQEQTIAYGLDTGRFYIKKRAVEVKTFGTIDKGNFREEKRRKKEDAKVLRRKQEIERDELERASGTPKLEGGANRNIGGLDWITRISKIIIFFGYREYNAILKRIAEKKDVIGEFGYLRIMKRYTIEEKKQYFVDLISEYGRKDSLWLNVEIKQMKLPQLLHLTMSEIQVLVESNWKSIKQGLLLAREARYQKLDELLQEVILQDAIRKDDGKTFVICLGLFFLAGGGMYLWTYGWKETVRQVASLLLGYDVQPPPPQSPTPPGSPGFSDDWGSLPGSPPGFSGAVIPREMVTPPPDAPTYLPDMTYAQWELEHAEQLENLHQLVSVVPVTIKTPKPMTEGNTGVLLKEKLLDGTSREIVEVMAKGSGQLVESPTTDLIAMVEFFYQFPPL